MKTIILLIFTTLITWANGSFYDLYAQNRAKNRPNLITADFIASAYATYKLSREQEIEKSILKPRVINFANFLYQGIVEMPMPNKKQALAYTPLYASMTPLKLSPIWKMHISQKPISIKMMMNKNMIFGLIGIVLGIIFIRA